MFQVLEYGLLAPLLCAWNLSGSPAAEPPSFGRLPGYDLTTEDLGSNGLYFGAASRKLRECTCKLLFQWKWTAGTFTMTNRYNVRYLYNLNLYIYNQIMLNCVKWTVQVGKGAIVAGDAVMLPHSLVESHAIVGAMSVAGRPVKSDLQLVGPGLMFQCKKCQE